ncbi:MAG: hypothetical protein E7294_10890 [Lachnospiraceae bacterium]|nr:hypothetical protein [Lachnospiraceae bacterium]
MYMKKTTLAFILAGSLILQSLAVTAAPAAGAAERGNGSFQEAVSLNGIAGDGEENTENVQMDEPVQPPSYTKRVNNYHEIEREAPEFVKPVEGKYPAQQAVSYPAVFDMRKVDTNGDGIADRSFLPAKLRDQGEFGVCWAFAVLAACESNLIKKGLEDRNIALSVNHLAYHFYNKGTAVTDLLKNTGGDYNRSKDIFHDAGGNNLFTMWQLASWAGPVKESRGRQYSYSAISDTFTLPDTPEEIYGISDFHVQNAYIVNTKDFQGMKQLLVNFGALSIAYYSTTGADISNYDSMAAGKKTGDEGCYYVNKDKTSNHIVSIVGWNDNYPASNFVKRPAEGNGAWLIRNSWGEEDSYCAQDGYFWLSYYDQSMENVAVAYDCEAADNYTNIYQHDGAAGDAQWNKTVAAANVFTTAAAAGKDELIRAVSVGVYQANAQYQLKVYAFPGGTKVDFNTLANGVLVSSQSGTFPFEGYYTVRLNKPVTVSAGQQYAVVFEFPQTAKVSYDRNQNYDWIRFYTAHTNDQSFVKEKGDSRWYYCSDGNFRIKAFTDNLETSISGITVSQKSTVLKSGTTQTISATVQGNSPNKLIGWTSDNPQIAKVSGGVIRALGCGTTTIHAYAANGMRSDCVVTVTLPDVGTDLAAPNGDGYVVTGVAKTPEVEYMGPKRKKAKKVTIPAKITINNVSYKVTSIADNAFKGNKKIQSVTIASGVKKIGARAFFGAKNLKNITVKSAILKKIGKNAFKGIAKNAVIKVPKKKKNAYLKLFKRKGQASTVEIR